MKVLRDIGELKLIDMFRSAYKAKKHTMIGIGDDAGVIKKGGGKKLLLFTCDMVVEGVHFLMKEASGFKIGWKALGAGISDIAAMGGTPKSAVVSIGAPSGTSVRFIKDFIRGLNTLADRFGVDIVGGDTVSSPCGVVISIAAIGEVNKKYLTLRSGAKAGDKILVTGTLGGSRVKKQYTFMPRIKEAQWLTQNGKISAMMDITDGLSIDLKRLIDASGVGALLYKEGIPISKDAHKGKNPLASALNDGEDFELLFTTRDHDALIKKWKQKNIPLTIIGETTKEKGNIKMIDKNRVVKNIIPKGYEHFK